MTGVRRSSGSRAPHLQLRRGVVHLRVRVPGDVRPILGLREVRRSLGPCGHTRARLLVAIYAARVMEAFEMVRVEQPTRERALQQIRRCFSDLVEQREGYSGFVPSSDQPELEIAEQREASQARISELQAQLQSREFDGLVQQVAEPYAAVLPPGKFGGRDLVVEGVARALIEDEKLFIVRLSDRLVPFAPTDSLFHGGGSPMQLASPHTSSPGVQAKGPTVAEAVGLYLEFGRSEWVPKTYEARIWQLGYLQAALGPETPLACVTMHDVRLLRDAIISLRKNHGRSPKQTLREKQTDNASARISPKTASIIFDACRAMFRWAVSSEGLIGSNPAENVRMSLTKSDKAKKPRRPFTAEELTTLFRSPLFTGCKTIDRRYAPGPKVIRDAKFWIPILGYYTGARMGELVQLHLADIHLDGPTPYLSINDENAGSAAGSNKHLKTAAAARSVPLHPDVILLGFAAYVDQLRAKTKGKGSARVFPDVLYGCDGQASTVFSKFFGRLMDNVGLSDPALVFHSFRHGAEDAFRNAKQPQYVIDRIIGHNDGATSSGYGQGIDLETAYAAVQAMKLPVRLTNLCAPPV